MNELNEITIINLIDGLVLEINPDEGFKIRKKKEGDKIIINISEFEDSLIEDFQFFISKKNDRFSIECVEYHSNGEKDSYYTFYPICYVWEYEGYLWINPEYYDPRVAEKRKEKERIEKIERIENNKKKKIKAFLEMMKGGEDYSNEIMELI